MAIIRRLLAVVLVCAAVICFALASLVLGPGQFAISDTIKHSRMINAAFLQTSTYVDSFRATHNRLPSKEELAAWAKDQPRALFPPAAVTIWTSSSQPYEHGLGSMPSDSYMLGLWRGEWWEYFAGWSGESTLTFDPGAYYLFGGLWRDVAVLSVTGLALLLGYRWVKP